MTEVGDTEILKNSIIEDAKAEAGKIVEEAEKTAAQKRGLAEAQIRKILDEARRRATDQCAVIEQAAKSAAELNIRKQVLRTQEEMWNAVLSRVREGLKALADTPAYREVLKSFIVEGAVGLGVSKVLYNATAGELPLIDQALLAEASREAEALGGMEVTLLKAEEKPLAGQGVVLRSEDGRLVFNNQIGTRIRRFDAEIRKIIAKELYD